MKNDFSKLLVLIVICAGAATQSSLLAATVPAGTPLIVDRKSTRLNSSHLVISYAVFCLKKKKNRSGSVRPNLETTLTLHARRPAQDVRRPSVPYGILPTTNAPIPRHTIIGARERRRNR